MRKSVLGIFILCCFIGQSVHLFAQENEFLRGKVLDQNTGDPLVFATIRIVGKAKGVVTNMDGSFRLPLSYREAGETIQISSMGYEKRDIELIQLSPKEINILSLVPGTFVLTETTVSAKKKREPSARQIIRRAIENIPDNYPITKFSTKGYYRDYQWDSLGYLNLNEALLQVFDYGFNRIDSATTKTRIYDYNQNMNFRRDTLADNSYNYKDWQKIINNAYLQAHGGNEFAILRVHDAIRNYRINSFDFINSMYNRDMLKNHSFKKLPETYLEGEPLYTIQIKKILQDYEAWGTLYISKNNFAIHKLQYAVYDDKKRNKNEGLQEKGIYGQLIFEIVAEYKKGADYKMYLNYISFHNTFQLANPPKFVIDNLMVSVAKGAFILNFNNQIAKNAVYQNNKYYDFKYLDTKIKFKEIKIKEDSSIFLFPAMSQRSLDNMLGEIETMARKKVDIGSVLKFKVNPLEDVEGNVLNKWTYKNYDQFREFFAQETAPFFEPPTDGVLMDMAKPIFQDQPIVKPDDFTEYWMNTPLKTIEE